MTSENGATAARIVVVDGNDDHEQSNKRPHSEENNVMDVQLRPELVIHMPVQETANGDHTPSGLNVTNHVMEDPKTGLEFCNKLLSTEEWTVLDKLLSSETATYMDVQLSVWSQWDLCTRSCGGGMQGRTRSVLVPERNGGKRCVGDPAEMRNCNMQA